MVKGNNMSETARRTVAARHSDEYQREQRRKLIRQKRLRERKRQRFIRRMVLLSMAGILLYFGFSVFYKPSAAASSIPSAASRLDSKTLSFIQELAKQESSAKAILEHPEDYPDELLTVLKKNTEALDFVLAYPKHKEDTPADTIGTIEPGVIPHLLQWDIRWGYEHYGDGMLAATGCGPTCLSMVVCGLTGDTSATPNLIASYAEDNGYYVTGSGTSWDMMTKGASAFGVIGRELSLDELSVLYALEAGHPIICSMRPGDFTKGGHFIVLTGIKDGKIKVNDPNSILRSETLWDYGTLAGQIKNLWVFE